MACSACGEAQIVFSVPDVYREYAPAETSIAAICRRCLTVDAAGRESNETDPRAGEPEFDRISDAFPSERDSAVPLALALGLCSSLATNRESIAALLEETERAGVDPLLVLDRLLADSTVEPAIDLERRRHQIEQLLY